MANDKQHKKSQAVKSIHVHVVPVVIKAKTAILKLVYSATADSAQQLPRHTTKWSILD